MALSDKQIEKLKSSDYWIKRSEQMIKNLEKDEMALIKKLNRYYAIQGKKIEKQISEFYGMYGKDNIIEYRELLKTLSYEEKTLLMKDVSAFMREYPELSHLEEIRKKIYKLDRLEGIRVSMLINQYEIGKFEQKEIEKHLIRVANKNIQDSLNVLGFGKNFNMVHSEAAKKLVKTAWTSGGNYSERIWSNREALATHLTNEFRNSIIRGDTYKECSKVIADKFTGASLKNAERLVRTEGTYIMNEASITPFVDEFEEYEYCAIFDNRTSEICKNLDGKRFNMSERQAGVNFPPMHPWCRSTYSIVVPSDWTPKRKK